MVAQLLYKCGVVVSLLSMVLPLKIYSNHSIIDGHLVSVMIELLVCDYLHGFGVPEVETTSESNQKLKIRKTQNVTVSLIWMLRCSFWCHIVSWIIFSIY
jgi:hypothetical protein